DYAFAIKEMDLDSLQYKTENFELDDIANAYSVQLFPHAFVPRPEFLYLAFPTSNPILKQMIWPISLAFIFTLLLLLSLILIINSLLHHKKLSAIKTDFINNMTHEFKTPIATIQLATDSVMSDKIITQPEKISYFMGLIKGENKRMNDLVERILQMAQLEKKTFDLLKSEVDAHQLLEAVVENSDLKIKEAQGEIKLNLKAAKCNLHADEVHLTNVFFNLIDNAIKYKSQHLHLEISTEIKGKFLSILFKDNGIGMDKDTLAHIFDKFFRLTEGNIHTVKGYGLGLSYVKVIVEKHHGTIHVQSQLGLGSRFELLLPLKD
ncbi:MAG: HAMP domain-containing histidine kinase, partial [Bacteroidales bacterium]|nr:HAMP domain-containing histidine kinase [Bacteroidales bacterium]